MSLGKKFKQQKECVSKSNNKGKTSRGFGKTHAKILYRRSAWILEINLYNDTGIKYVKK